MGDHWLIFLEAAVAVAVALLYLSARKAFSSEDIRRAVITENERLKVAVGKLTEEFEARAQEAIASLNKAVERAENAAGRLEELLAQADSGPQRPARPAISAQADPQKVAPSEKHKRVVALAREGRSVESIAKEVELGTGEVELVLNISKEGESPASHAPAEGRCESGNPNPRS